MSIYESAVKKAGNDLAHICGGRNSGAFSLNKLPIDLLPNIETNTIMVMTTYQGGKCGRRGDQRHPSARKFAQYSSQSEEYHFTFA